MAMISGDGVFSHATVGASELAEIIHAERGQNHLPGAYAAYLRDPAGNKICAHIFTAE